MVEGGYFYNPYVHKLEYDNCALNGKLPAYRSNRICKITDCSFFISQRTSRQLGLFLQLLIESDLKHNQLLARLPTTSANSSVQ